VTRIKEQERAAGDDGNDFETRAPPRTGQEPEAAGTVRRIMVRLEANVTNISSATLPRGRRNASDKY